MKISRERWYADLKYVPRNGARAMDAAIDAGKRFIGFFAFPQAGKSYHAARHLGVELLRPDVHVWLVAPKYEFGAKEFGYLYQDFNSVVVDGKTLLQRATRKHFDVRGGNMAIEFPWGSWVRVVSADNPDSLRMEQLDYVVLCEASALPEDLYQRFLYARVELRKGRVIVPTTPKGYNWCYDSFRLPALERVNFTYSPWVGCRRERVGGEENPKYDPLYWSAVVSATRDYGDVYEPNVHTEESVQRGRRLLPRQVFAEQFGGDFASYMGLILPFNPQLHECEPFTIPDAWTHIVGYDHGAGGGSDPTAILLGSYGEDGTLYWWGELYSHEQQSIASYGAKLRAYLGSKHPSAIMRGRDAKQVGIELAQQGIPTSYAESPLVSARIIKMTGLMQEGKWKMFRGRCPNLKRELLSWEWDERNPGQPRKGQSDHAIEAAGYASLAIVALPLKPEHDPLAPVGESAEVTRLWNPVRQWYKDREDEQELAKLEALAEDPFEEGAQHVVESAW